MKVERETSRSEITFLSRETRVPSPDGEMRDIDLPPRFHGVGSIGERRREKAKARRYQTSGDNGAGNFSPGRNSGMADEIETVTRGGL